MICTTHCVTIVAGTRYRLLVLSPLNVLLPAEANFIFVIVSSTPESQQVSQTVVCISHEPISKKLLPSQRFEESLRATYSYMNLHPSKRCLVKFNRDARAKFHVHVLNPAAFEVEAKDGLEEVCKKISFISWMAEIHVHYKYHYIKINYCVASWYSSTQVRSYNTTLLEKNW